MMMVIHVEHLGGFVWEDCQLRDGPEYIVPFAEDPVGGVTTVQYDTYLTNILQKETKKLWEFSEKVVGAHYP